MNRNRAGKIMVTKLARTVLSASLAIYVIIAPAAQAYSFGYTVADMRLPSG